MGKGRDHNGGLLAFSAARCQSREGPAGPLPCQETRPAKTTRQRLSEAEALILRLHDYALPEILVLPVLGGSAAYLDWIDAGTRLEEARK
ncbi:divalent cation tolerance protein CutA [Roseomonas gilardii]|uniref:divalent cation tolerance protein CutA n=1 Tax=Roseomonas gilardii TaxID=257708 RepID=UPI0011A1F9D6